MKKENCRHGGSIFISGKSEISAKETVDIVMRCLKGECGIQEAGRGIEVGKATIRRWISRYEAERADAFLPHERNRVYSVELKQQAVEAYLSGLGSLLEISKKYKRRDTRQRRDWLVELGRVPQGSTVVFWHTGGATALFAEPEMVGGVAGN